MKKFGFTLAEVMIALALIGVIASLTIPTFVANSRNRANASKLATTVSAVENAFTSMIASEAANDLTETRYGSEPTEINLGRFLKLSGTDTMAGLYGENTPFVTLNRTATALPVSNIYKMKNGAVLFFNAANVDPAEDDSHPGSIGQLTIDVNGSALPNVWGRDVFFFRIGNDGILYPAGGEKFELMDDNGANMSCEGNNKNQGCTARLIENNYEIDF